MISTPHKLKLMAIYTRPLLIISGAGSIAIFLLLVNVSLKSLIVTTITSTIFKIVITALAAILFRMMTSRDRDYFYINIGLLYLIKDRSDLVRYGYCRS